MAAQLILLLCLVTAVAAANGSNDKEPVQMCYYDSRAEERSGPGLLQPKDIDPKQCTHVVFSFLEVKASGELTQKNPRRLQEDLKSLRELKKKNKDLKLMFAIRCHGESLKNMLQKRPKVVADSIGKVLDDEFDGVDFFTHSFQKREEEETLNHLPKLLEIVKQVKQKTGRIVTATYHPTILIKKQVDVKILKEFLRVLDWLNIAAYDYHQHEVRRLSHHTPLGKIKHALSELKRIVSNMNDSDVTFSKFTLGLATYARICKLRSSEATHIGNATKGAAPKGEISQMKGLRSTYEVCTLLNGGEWTVEMKNDNIDAPIAYNREFWMSFDNIPSMQKKLELVKKHHLRGVSVWSIDMDDFMDKCKGEQKPHAPREERVMTIRDIGRYLRRKKVTVGTIPEGTDVSAPVIDSSKESVASKAVESLVKEVYPSIAVDRESKEIPAESKAVNVDRSETKEAVQKESPETKEVSSIPLVRETESKDVNVKAIPSSIVRACYYDSKAKLRQGLGKFTPLMINEDMCTHIMYAFAYMKPGSKEVFLTEENKKDLQQLQELKKKNPHLKILLGVNFDIEKGQSSLGWIQSIVKSIVSIVKSYELDGVDVYAKKWNILGKINWLRKRLFQFCGLLRSTSSSQSTKENPFILTITMNCNHRPDTAVEKLKRLQSIVNWINLVTYDLPGAHPTSVYHHTNLNTIKETVDYLLSNGIPASKLVMGLATYGRTFTLANKEVFPAGARKLGPGQEGKFTKIPGHLARYEICQRKFKILRDAEAGVPYGHSGNQWVSFDDIPSLRKKIAFGLSKKLLGFFVWSVDGDDFMNTCGKGKHSFIAEIRTQVHNYQVRETVVKVKELEPSKKIDVLPTIAPTEGPTVKPVTPGGGASMSCRAVGIWYYVPLSDAVCTAFCEMDICSSYFCTCN